MNPAFFLLLLLLCVCVCVCVLGGGGGGGGSQEGHLGRLVSMNNPNIIRLFTHINYIKIGYNSIR